MLSFECTVDSIISLWIIDTVSVVLRTVTALTGDFASKSQICGRLYLLLLAHDLSVMLPVACQTCSRGIFPDQGTDTEGKTSFHTFGQVRDGAGMNR